jgi:hypothetical protein
MREPVLWHVLVVVGWEGLATVEQHGYAQCHHHALLSTLLLSAVHPVTLYTPTQPSTAPLQADLSETQNPNSAFTLREHCLQ